MMRIRPPLPSGWPLLAVAVTLAATCATAAARKYPPRRAGCELQVFTSPAPEIQGGAWEDIGIAEAGCYLDESEVACLHRLRIEACRMGGDILYAVPRRAARPMERAMVMRAKVAHTLAPPSNTTEPAPQPPAPNEPVVPIAPRADAGTD